MHSNYFGASKFSSQMKNPFSRLFFFLICALFIDFYVQRHHLYFTDILKMHSHCFICCPLTFSLTSCLVILLSDIAGEHSLTWNRSGFNKWHSITWGECVCVWGGEEADLGELMADSQAAMHCQWPKPHAHSDTINESNIAQRWGVFFEGLHQQYIWTWL